MQFTITGRVGSAGSIRFVAAGDELYSGRVAGRDILQFSLVVDRHLSDEDDKLYEPDWVEVRLFNGLAKESKDSIVPGAQVVVMGNRIQSVGYAGKDTDGRGIPFLAKTVVYGSEVMVVPPSGYFDLLKKAGQIAFGRIDAIMAERGIEKVSVPYRVSASVSYTEAMQYARRYVGNGTRGSGPRYRIDRYIKSLNQAGITASGISLFDLGSGPGTFSWALLEWIAQRRQPIDNLRLVGLDHSAAMNAAALDIYAGIQQGMISVPPMQCYSSAPELIRHIRRLPSEQSHYLITLGYVLAGNHESAEMLETFTEIISAVVAKAKRSGQRCTLVVCDTETTSESHYRLEPGWDKLVSRLENAGIEILSSNEVSEGTRVANLA